MSDWTSESQAHSGFRSLLRAQEAERRRVARTLHDEIGQDLTAFVLMLQRLAKTADSKAVEALEEGIALVERMLARVRDLAVELRPSILDDLGIVPALRWYLDRQSRVVGYTARFTGSGEAARLSKDCQTVCFRVVQEALTNIARHARAQEVAVELLPEDGELHLRIRDDGVGFDVGSWDEATAGAALGLVGMRERALLVEGRFDIHSERGEGTQITVRLPLE